MNTTIQINGKDVEIELTPEQVSQIKQETVPVFWEPTDGEEAWHIVGSGTINSSARWRTDVDKSYIRQGNVFQTEALAQAEADLRAAKYRLKKAIFELNGCHWGWEDGRNDYFIVLNFKKLSLDHYISLKSQPSWMYLKSEELAEKLIETHKEDLLLVLGE